MIIPDFVREELQRMGIEVQESALDQMARFLEILLITNQNFNLTAARDIDAAWRRLILDSLTLLPSLDDIAPGGVSANTIDIGSGGGVPGIPLAIARPDLSFILLEAVGKKTIYLRRAVEHLKLGAVTVIEDRAENLGQDPAHRNHYDLAFSRAVGSVAEVLEYSLPLLKVGGRILAMKGAKAERELGEASDALLVLGGGDVKILEAYPHEPDRNLVIIDLVKQKPTPTTYPRRPGVPKRSPL